MQNRLGLNAKTGYHSYAKENAKSTAKKWQPFKGELLNEISNNSSFVVEYKGEKTKLKKIPNPTTGYTIVNKSGEPVSGKQLAEWEMFGANIYATVAGLPDSEREKFQNFRKSERKVVEGTDISETYEGPTDIRSVLKAQGFEGPPKLMKKADFDKAVQASSFIAQRSYSASSQEVLDAYTDMLHNGYWYVECTTGGAQYGQGMYCAADYTGTLSDGITNEMSYYDMVYDQQLGRLKTKDEWLNDAKKALDGAGYTDETAMQWAEVYFDADTTKYTSFYAAIPIDTLMGINNILAGVRKDIPCLHRRETITLDPSAKIISYSDLFDLWKTDTASKKYANISCYAASLGYDAINAENHGQSGSYTVILNRTKCIFLDDSEEGE